MTWAIFKDDSYISAVRELLEDAARPSGSGRVMAVVGGALLEEAVEKTLRARLKKDKAVSRLVNPMGNGALAFIAPQIDALYALGAFDGKHTKH